MANTPGTAFLGGGVTPEQASLAQYDFGERAIGGASRFGASGLGMSTNETMAGTVGPEVGQAVQLGNISDQLSAALGSFANAQQLAAKGLTQQQIGTIGSLLGSNSSLSNILGGGTGV